MSIKLIGMDHKTASIEVREKMAFTETESNRCLKKIKEMPGVWGCVLLSTCNRTELYVSMDDSVNYEFASVLWGDISNALFYRKSEMDAARHLMAVASGLKSLIIGEDQIITQVRQALSLARGVGVTDSILETLFRRAITSGKKIKTDIVFKGIPTSSVENALVFLKKQLGDLRGKTALVIGNGDVGYEAANLLMKENVDTTITLRQYKRGFNKIPFGCDTIAYDDRLLKIETVDFVFSCTKSPHFTLTKKQVADVLVKPSYLVDLAIPRDIDPEVADLEGVHLYNIDTLGKFNLAVLNEAEIKKSQKIIDGQMANFCQWLKMRECALVIDSIKKEATLKVNGSLTKYNGNSDHEKLSFIVNKTVDMLMYSLKEDIDKELLLKVKNELCNEKGER